MKSITLAGAKVFSTADSIFSSPISYMIMYFCMTNSDCELWTNKKRKLKISWRCKTMTVLQFETNRRRLGSRASIKTKIEWCWGLVRVGGRIGVGHYWCIWTCGKPRCRGPKRREGRSRTDSPQGWWSLSPWSMQPTFQSTDESVSRDAPKINGFPVPGGTTPSRGFLEGSVGRLRDRPSGVSGASGAVDEFERGR